MASLIDRAVGEDTNRGQKLVILPYMSGELDISVLVVGRSGSKEFAIPLAELQKKFKGELKKGEKITIDGAAYIISEWCDFLDDKNKQIRFRLSLEPI